MPRVELAAEVGEDLDRILKHLASHDVEQRRARVFEIMQTFDVLQSNPFVGRPISENRRELVIGRGSRGYVALYRYVTEIDTVFVLVVRSQREAGYQREDP